MNSARSLRQRLLIALEIAVPLALLLLWWVTSSGSQNPFFPPLSTILVRFQQLWLFSHFASDVVPSVSNLLLGFFIGSAIGLVFGVVFALARPLKEISDPVVHFWRAIPPVAIIPIFISIFGFGDWVRIVVISLTAVFPTLIATMDGIRGLEPQLRDVSRVYGLTPWEKILSVYIPGAGPNIFSGLQVSLQYSLVVMIASEMLGASTGIGAMTLLAQQSFESPSMWAGILLLGLIGYLSNLIFLLVRKRVLRWYDGAKKSERAF